MYEAYRVRRRFQWRGWEYAPGGQCECSKQVDNEGKGSCEAFGCTGEVGTGCEACYMDRCRCACNIPPERYGGEIWIVESGNPRKEMILRQRFAVGDVSIPPVDELLKDEKYSRLLEHPLKVNKKVKATAK